MVEPFGVAGVALGGASLLIQLLDGAVKGYTFFLAVGEMERECLELHTRLEMEQQRLLNFAQAAKLLEHKEGEGLFPGIRSQNLVLASVFSQIENKLDAFVELTEYKQIRQANQQHKEDMDQEQYDSYNVSGNFSSLKIKWAQSAKKREHLRGTNHIRKFYKIGKDAVTDPRRLKWTAFDRDKFQSLLNDLVSYNDYLDGILHGEFAKRLEETTRNTAFEMVIVRKSVDDMTRLIRSLMLMTPHRGANDPSHERFADIASNSYLDALARTKRVSIANDHASDSDPPDYDHGITVEKLPYQSLDIGQIPAKDDVVTLRQRSEGQFWPHGRGGAHVDVWIEWKSYVLENDQANFYPRESNVQRVKGLVALLKSSHLPAFHVPECVGYFDLREDLDDANSHAQSAHPSLFGIVYHKPDSTPSFATRASPLPVSLYQLFATDSIPSLTTRIKLAHAVATSLLYLNTARWFHKALRSDAIVFHRQPTTSEIDYTAPFVTGFEYSRPDTSRSLSSTLTRYQPEHAMYVHPAYQQMSSTADESSSTASTVHFSRNYDIYSLGIILLEIAYWLPIRDIMRPEYGDSNGVPNDKLTRSVRNILLGLDKSAKCRTYLSILKERVGERYHAAVLGCIEGLIDLVKDKEGEPEVDVKLHERFMDRVVDGLGDVVI